MPIQLRLCRDTIKNWNNILVFWMINKLINQVVFSYTLDYVSFQSEGLIRVDAESKITLA